MAIGAALGRIVATVVAMVHTRLELAAVEVQEEAQRLLGYFAWMLLAVLLGAGALFLAALFVILLFWESYRLHAVGGMAVLFAAAGAVIFLKVRSSFDARPALLSGTLAELRNDVELVTGAEQAHEQ